MSRRIETQYAYNAAHDHGRNGKQLSFIDSKIIDIKKFAI